MRFVCICHEGIYILYDKEFLEKMNGPRPDFNVVLTSVSQNKNCSIMLVQKSNAKFDQNTFFTVAMTCKSSYYYSVIPHSDLYF